jgi:hypothetical protein
MAAADDFMRETEDDMRTSKGQQREPDSYTTGICHEDRRERGANGLMKNLRRGEVANYRSRPCLIARRKHLATSPRTSTV